MRGPEFRVLSHGDEGARVGGFEPWGGGDQSTGF